MRFYRPADAAHLEIQGPRLRFFFLGPFYLLWLRLWLEAALVAGITWALVHGTLLRTRTAMGGSAEIDLDAVMATLTVLRESAGRSPEADAAFQQLMATLLPYYAAGLMLLVVMGALTWLLPRYLVWRYGRRGWRPLAGAAAPEDAVR